MLEKQARVADGSVFSGALGILGGIRTATPRTSFREREKEMSVRPVLAVMALIVSLPLASTGWAKNDPCDLGSQPPCAEASNCEPVCCAARCERSLQVFGELLYLRPRNDGLEYAVPINGPITPGSVPIQAGRTASLNPEIEPGFRVGGGFDFDCCSNITATYTHYENSVDDSISTTTPLALRSMVVHPSSADAAYDWLSATAHELIRFNIADIDYRHEILLHRAFQPQLPARHPLREPDAGVHFPVRADHS